MTELLSWPRPHFTPGGGDAVLFYAVFGDFDLTKPLIGSHYRTSGLPSWLKMVQHNREKNGDVLKDFKTGKAWELIQRDSPLLAAQSEKAPECVGVQAIVPDPATLDYFRDVIGVVTWLLDVGGVTVFDPSMLWMWPAEEWRNEAFQSGEPNPDRHTTIMVSPQEDGTNWYHTRGMRKYGRPDLSVHGVGPNHADAVSLMIERLIEFQALGGIIAEGKTIEESTLPAGGVCHHAGSLENQDFNNLHVEIKWPTGALTA